jgi:alpha-N-arabinofuranosidase
MTEPGGKAWRQTTYYPYYFASRFGRGTALDVKVEVAGYDTEMAKNVAYADVAAVHDEATGTVTLFAVNRHASEAVELDVALGGFEGLHVVDHQVITNSDLEATNTAKASDTVVPRAGNGASVNSGRLAVTLPPYSYQMIRLKA